MTFYEGRKPIKRNGTENNNLAFMICQWPKTIEMSLDIDKNFRTKWERGI